MKNLILSLIGVILFCGYIQANDIIIKKKNYNKVFTVSNNVRVELQSNYANIKYLIGSNSQVEYHAEVVVDGPDEKVVDKKLNSITVEFAQGSDWVKATTKFENYNARKTNIKINYIVKIPAGASVKINGNYLDVFLPELKNDLSIQSNYADVIGEGNIGLFSFSGNYCDVRFKQSAQKALIGGNYNTLKFNNIENINLNGNYTEVFISQLGKLADLKGNYDEFKINAMKDSNISVSISGNYLDVSLTPNNSSNITVLGNYTDANYDDHFNVIKKISRFSQLKLVLQSGTNTNSEIYISGNYNDVTLK